MISAQNMNILNCNEPEFSIMSFHHGEIKLKRKLDKVCKKRRRTYFKRVYKEAYC